MEQPNIVETLKPEELPEYLKYCEAMLRDFDGEEKQVREDLREQIKLVRKRINKTKQL